MAQLSSILVLPNPLPAPESLWLTDEKEEEQAGGRERRGGQEGKRLSQRRGRAEAARGLQGTGATVTTFRRAAH